MKQLLRSLTICALIVVATVSNSKAFAWGLAFHAYLAEQLAQSPGAKLPREVMYGAILPDAFNLRFDSNVRIIRNLTHDFSSFYVDAASRCTENSSAYGFATHNDEWGADFIAHHSSHIYPGRGWVIVKSEQIAPQVEAAVLKVLIRSGVPQSVAESIANTVASEFSHFLIELAVDIQLRRTLDLKIGSKLRTAATWRSSRVRANLLQAYAAPLAGQAGISLGQVQAYLSRAERDFRTQLKIYGTILSLDPLRGNEDEVITRKSAEYARQRLQQELVARRVRIKRTGIQLGLISDLIHIATESVGIEWQAEIEPTLRDLDAGLRARGISPCLLTVLP